MDAAPADLARALAGRYRLLDILGRGGSATVYLAEDLKHGRRVAIKVLDRELASAIGPQRFRREIETAARLSHPNLVPLFDSGEADGLFWYVMPHVAGESLRARLAREMKLPVDEALRIAGEILDALAHAHENGLVHRDIKPENILLSSGHALVADFGISHALAPRGRDATGTGEATTLAGFSLGTPLYMAPEQFSSPASVDARADLYGVGCVLYEMLAGEPPFPGSSVQAIQARHAFDPVPPLRTGRPGVSADVERAVLHALAKDPADRPVDARSYAAELARVAREGADPAGVPGHARRPVRRRRLLVVAIAVAAVAVLGVIAWREGLLDRLRGSMGGDSGTERRWVLLATFTAPANDPMLGVVARDLVAAALDQSGTLATVPPDQVRSALRLAGRPDTSRVEGELARELAFRSSIRVVVEGTIHRAGAGYTTVLRAVDAESGAPVVTITETSADERDLVPSLGRVAARLRRGLGEHDDALVRTRPLVEAATPSFAAYKAYLQGRDLTNEGDAGGARRFYRTALDFDPGFALAWMGLSVTYSNRGVMDSANWALDQAERYADRLSDVRRLDLAAKRAALEHDYPAAIAAYERALLLDPNPTDRATLENNRGTILEIAGRYGEALGAYQAAARLAPVEPSHIFLANQIEVFVALGRVAEAKALIPRLRGPARSNATLVTAALSGEWQRADSAAAAVVSNPTLGPGARVYHASARLGLFVRRGEWGEAERVLVFARETAPRTIPFDQAVWASWVFADLRGRPLPDAPASEARTLQAFFVALEGDSARVRADARRLSVVEFHHDQRAQLFDEIEGLLAFREERWDDAIRALAPMARGSATGGWNFDRLRNRARWTVAKAFERSGQPDSAAAYLARILEPGTWTQATVLERPLYEPFVRDRLLRLALARGRHAEARAQWDELQRAMTRPDPEAQRFLDESRDALAMAGALSPGQD